MKIKRCGQPILVRSYKTLNSSQKYVKIKTKSLLLTVKLFQMPLTEETLYQIALAKTVHIGPSIGRSLLDEYGSAREVFKAPKKELVKISKITERIVNNLADNVALKRAEQELNFIDKHGIQVHFITDREYPRRLKFCKDAPLCIFTKGLMDLNAEKMVAVVGTRKATPYGREQTEKIVTELAQHNVTIISGLAFGIDITAHRTAQENNLQTAAVLAHGLDRIYPREHTQTAKRMLENGGLITDYWSGTNPDMGNFPERNRIIAGLCDATLVMESRLQGGSLITGKLAFKYNRDVFAFPGKSIDNNSRGCNFLIKSHQAALIEDVKDIEYQMGWEKSKKKKKVQKKLFVELNDEEQAILDILKDKKLALDEIGLELNKSTSQISTHLFNLEMNGLIKSLPGKMYQLN